MEIRSRQHKPELYKEISDYFSALFGGGKTKKFLSEQNDIVFTIGEYLFLWQQNNEKTEVPARFTFVFSKENDKWKIFHRHSSILQDN